MHAARGADSRLGALAWMLRAMAAEEDSRDAWVRFHLSQVGAVGPRGQGGVI